MGQQIVDMQVSVWKGSDLYRFVDVDVNLDIQTNTIDNSASGTPITSTVKRHRGFPPINDGCPNTANATQTSNMQNASSQTSFDLYASAAFGAWFNTKTSAEKAALKKAYNTSASAP